MGHYIGWVGMSGDEWEYVGVRGGEWGYVGVSGGEWEWVHCLIMFR